MRRTHSCAQKRVCDTEKKRACNKSGKKEIENVGGREGWGAREKEGE